MLRAEDGPLLPESCLELEGGSRWLEWIPVSPGSRVLALTWAGVATGDPTA